MSREWIETQLVREYEPTYRERVELCRRLVTLNGEPAVLIGARLDHAVVAALPNGARAVFSWSAARRIVAAGGNFVLHS